MPIPYMGSKRKSAQMIFNTINNYNKDSKSLVDLFCGGYAISEYFYKKGWNVRSNDKNKHVVALIKKVTSKEGLGAKVLDFVDRGTFKDVLINPNNYEDWYVGYVQCVWSFGNTQKTYMFGKEVEPIKRAGHELVVNKKVTDLIKRLIPKKYIDGILKQDTSMKRRAALVKVSRVLKNRKLELQQLERLQQLQQLERLQQLEVTSMSYEKVGIKKGDIIYCDPPYKGTAEYKEGGFNHEVFWDWVREVSKSNKVYISEYSAPSDFISILEFSQKSTLQGGSQQHSDQPHECLFVHKDQENFKETITG